MTSGEETHFSKEARRISCGLFAFVVGLLVSAAQWAIQNRSVGAALLLPVIPSLSSNPSSPGRRGTMSPMFAASMFFTGHRYTLYIFF